jgi:hypothetical protein
MRDVKYKINYLYKEYKICQENTMIFNHTQARFILCFNIDLKELKDSEIFASWGRSFQCKAPL